MLEQDAKDEENAIKLYKNIIETAAKENDQTTARIFRKILEEEEEHHDTFTTLLEDL
jgi:bacterioferritin